VLIDRFMPTFDVVERHAVIVRASPEEAFRAIRRMDLARSLPIRALFALRGLPALVGGRAGRRRSWTLDDIIEAGFVLLAEEPGVELVLGVVGRFWKPTGGVVRVPAEDFAGFDRPGLAKGAWNFRVEPGGEGRVRVTTETRVSCTDQASRRSFLRYWRVVGPFSGFIRSRALSLVRTEAERARGRAAGNMTEEGGPSR
jgi:hypothetical protein